VKEFSFVFGDEILPRFAAAAAFVATVSSATALLLSSHRLLESGLHLQ
jgi:hypothetical protein